MSKTLYLCYFGLREPLVQTQVLPYLREIKKGGMEVFLLTFEPNPKKKWTDDEIQKHRQKLAEEGIKWDFLTYHRRPSLPATLFDVFSGTVWVWRKVRREKIDILHGRIHIPTMMGVIAKKFISGKKTKILFDIRGFMPEEYTDAGIWKENGRLYKAVKSVEKWLLRESDGFVVLTEKAREIMFPESKETGFDKLKRPVEVIPCCIDAKRFDLAKNLSRKDVRRELNLEDKRVFVYVGSFGGWYLTDEMIDFLKVFHQQYENAFSMILTQRDTEKAEKLLTKAGLPKNDFLIKSVLPDEIPRYLRAADVAISFIKKCYSKQAASPTKIAEYLAAGLPIISNSGVGDLNELIEDERVGIILNGFSEQDYKTGLEKIEEYLQDDNLREHCRNIAHKYFDLQTVGGENYRRLYRKLLNESE